jgi:RimJ/RimL family protein N-acetyltransferase
MRALPEMVPLEHDDELHLSLIQETDAQDIFKLYTASADMRHPLSAQYEFTESSAERVARNHRRNLEEGCLMPYIVRTQTEMPIGLVNLGPRYGEYAELEYAIVADKRRRGIASAAAATLLQQGQALWGLKRVGLQIDPGNEPSKATARHIGANYKATHDTTPEFGRPFTFESWEIAL